VPGAPRGAGGAHTVEVVRSRKIFVVGTGRSGTHWLGWTLESHPDIRATIEEPSIFERSTRAALDPGTSHRALAYLRARYAVEHLRSLPRHYLDKSHPNLWHVEQLASTFPGARFIGVQRGVYGTVASMLQHEGVLQWQRRWRDFPVPNAFLGITPDVAEVYDDLTLPAQCALRWQAHRDRLTDVQRSLPDRVLVVRYEDMADDYLGQARRIWQFAGLREVPLTITVRTDARDGWREVLTPADIADIDDILAASW
jgi:hypothetical protein